MASTLLYLFPRATDTIETAEYFVRFTQICFCATYAVVVWEWLILFPREYRFIWKTPWTPVKVAYIYCRYWVLFDIPFLLWCFASDHSLEACQRLYRVPVGLAMFNQVAGQVILLIRTYAFFNQNHTLLCFLCFALSGVIAYQLYVTTSQMLLLPFFKPPFDRGPCFPQSKPHSAHLLGFFLSPLLFDTLVTFMTVWRAFTIRRQNGSPHSRLIQTFLREGVFYYILISVANLINGIFYFQPRQVISAINIPLSVMIAPILACRLILDLRERGSETVEGTGITFTTKSMVQDPYSPFSTPGRSRGRMRNTFGHNSRGLTVSSNVMLSTMGSVDLADAGYDHDIEDIKFGMELGSLSTAIGGDDGEPIPEGESQVANSSTCHSTPDLSSRRYYSGDSIDTRSDVPGIRVDVERDVKAL